MIRVKYANHYYVYNSSSRSIKEIYIYIYMNGTAVTWVLLPVH